MKLPSVFALAFLLSSCGVENDPDSCDLDPFFSDSEQNVNCVEDVPGNREYTCTCPDGSTFASSDTCEKTGVEQGELIDSACPVPADDA